MLIKLQLVPTNNTINKIFNSISSFEQGAQKENSRIVVGLIHYANEICNQLLNDAAINIKKVLNHNLCKMMTDCPAEEDLHTIDRLYSSRC